MSVQSPALQITLPKSSTSADGSLGISSFCLVFLSYRDMQYAVRLPREAARGFVHELGMLNKGRGNNNRYCKHKYQKE
jgi:hypothetical protein